MFYFRSISFDLFDLNLVSCLKAKLLISKKLLLFASVKVLKNDANTFYLILKALFVFDHTGKRLDNKAKVNVKIYDVIDWETDNYNTSITQYLKM